MQGQAHNLAQDIQEALANAEAVGSVQMIETHISRVFLTEHFVYKLKKPIKFEFVDYSSAELRRMACEEEVRINRRMAKEVYLGVLPITQTDDGHVHIAGDGHVVDWMVKMVRLPAEMALDQLIVHQQLSDTQLAALLKWLLTFYAQAQPIEWTPAEYVGSIEHHVLANRAELLEPVHQFDLPMVHRIHAAQLRLLACNGHLLEERLTQRRIIDGHGDLRPEHLYCTPQPVAIDGLEFSAELRRVDMLDELCFLAMELKMLGAKPIADQIFKAYGTELNDQPAPGLLLFYQAYRACVRAKVSALRARQLQGQAQLDVREHARQYLAMAESLAMNLAKPLLIIVWGLSGSGKSFLSQALSRKLGSHWLQTDALRQEIFSPPKSADPTSMEVRKAGRGTVPEFDAEQYSEVNRAKVYDEMLRRAAVLLAAGQSVILDASFLKRQQRSMAASLAQTHGADFLSVYCYCPQPLAQQRILERLQQGDSLSEFQPEFAQAQRQALEADVSPMNSCQIDTTIGLETMLTQVCQAAPISPAH